MRIISERAELNNTAGMDVLHAEVSFSTNGGILYARAHDNTLGRFYELSTQSYFGDWDAEEEPIEEYSSSGEPDDGEITEPDFFALLRDRDRMDMPYESSGYADLFQKADRMLDDLAEGLEDE